MALDIAFCALSLLVYTLVTFLIILHLRRVSAPLRNVQSMENLIWALAGACIEAGAFLVIAQISVVVLIVLDSPAVIIAESVATQFYVRVSIHPCHLWARPRLLSAPRSRS